MEKKSCKWIIVISLFVFISLLCPAGFAEQIQRGSINIGESRTSWLSNTSEDIYTLYIPFDQQVTIEMFRADGSSLDPLVILQYSYGTEVARDDDGAGYPNARIVRYLNSGSYRIIASAMGSSSGSYRLSIYGGGGPGPGPVTPNPATFGKAGLNPLMRGSIGVGQTATYTLLTYEKHIYQFYVSYGRSVTIEMFKTDGSSLDCYLELFDNSGNPVASNDDGAGYPNSRIIQYLNAGTYWIIARDLSGNSGGNYRLSTY
jgi:hypothetical protein